MMLNLVFYTLPIFKGCRSNTHVPTQHDKLQRLVSDAEVQCSKARQQLEAVTAERDLLSGQVSMIFACCTSIQVHFPPISVKLF